MILACRSAGRAKRIAGPGVRPRRLPNSLSATARALGRISEATNESESENSRWWMSISESMPYTAHDDAAVPVGTVIPGIIVADTIEVRRGDVRGFGRWAAG